MYFGTWVDVEGQYFDTAHFPDCLEKYPFQGGGCYLLLGTVEVDFHFPTITVIKMAKMPFIPDPRYNHDKQRAFDVHRQIREDVSITQAFINSSTEAELRNETSTVPMHTLPFS